MATTRIPVVLGWVAAIALPLLAVSSARAQPMLYPVYGPWGVYYVQYYPSYPGPLYPSAIATSATPSSNIVRTAASSTPAYAAPSSGGDSRPSYYSEDYAGPEGPANEPSKVAYIRVRVPASAEIWINDQKRTQRGALRDFVTPALDPDHIYVYNVKARWTEEGGINVEKTLRVRTISGTRVTVNFVRPPAAQPRQTVQTAIATVPSPPALAPRVEQQPVDWYSNAAPRSFR